MPETLVQKPTSRPVPVIVIIHILVWAVVGMVLFVYQPLAMNISLPYQFWLKQLIVMVMLIAAYYINARLLVPKLLLKNRVRDFFLLVILLIGVIVMIAALADPWLHIPQLMEAAFRHKGPPKKGGGGHHNEFSVFMITVVALVVGISTSITAIQKWQKDQRLRQELEQEKTTSELSFLKAQINPHFFFNTLNNIYALTVVDVEGSRQAIHKLSRMMRYLLYETQHGTTLLSKEIGFINDYIDLMQLRLTDKVTLKFSHPENLKDIQIAPMLFLPFVENAFKHGISSTLNSYISIVVLQGDNQLTLEVENTVFDDQQASMEGSSGIGLTNTRRRLDLMYPEKYSLQITERSANDRYIVKLILNLV